MIHGIIAELSENFFFDKIAKSIRCLVFMNFESDVRKKSLKVIGEIDSYYIVREVLSVRERERYRERERERETEVTSPLSR